MNEVMDALDGSDFEEDDFDGCLDLDECRLEDEQREEEIERERQMLDVEEGVGAEVDMEDVDRLDTVPEYTLCRLAVR